VIQVLPASPEKMASSVWMVRMEKTVGMVSTAHLALLVLRVLPDRAFLQSHLPERRELALQAV
jgi:hypothetical protein